MHHSTDGFHGEGDGEGFSGATKLTRRSTSRTNREAEAEVVAAPDNLIHPVVTKTSWVTGLRSKH